MRHKVMFLLSAVLLLLTITQSIAAAQETGASDAVHLCRDGGWQQLRGAGGVPFANQGECVSHAAQGGSFAYIYVTREKLNAAQYCGYEVHAVGFPLGHYYLESTGGRSPYSTWSYFYQDPWRPFSHTWPYDGQEYTITVSIYNYDWGTKEVGEFLGSDTLTFQCDAPVPA